MSGLQSRRWVVAALAAVALSSSLTAETADARWSASWSMAPSGGAGGFSGAGQNLRMLISPHRGGRWVRVELSNAAGDRGLRVDSATVAKTAIEDSPELAPASLRRLRFDGKRRVTIPAGRSLRSDPVRLRVHAFEQLAVSLHLPDPPGLTTHWAGEQRSYLTPAGDDDATGIADGAGFTRSTGSWYTVRALEVKRARRARDCGNVVALGDSITDGIGSTFSADRRYPDYLQRRLSRTGLPASVVNAGVSGNQVLVDDDFLSGPSALHRLRRDVLSVPRLRAVLVFEGINDLGAGGATASQLRRALRKLIRRIHAHGADVALATLTPVGGSMYADPAEPERSRLNRWIRRQRLSEAVADFDRAVRDPSDPLRLRPRYSADGVHLSDAGYRRLARTAAPAVRRLLRCR